MHVASILPRVFSACALILTVSSWNFDIHNQIGFMAEEYMTDQAKWVVGQILEPQYNGSIGRAAHWADTVSKTTHKYSYGWHWTSAKDDPPNNCHLYYHRDCQAGGCSISQIYNQTRILQGCIKRVRDGSLGPANPDVDCQQALKWVVHFIGDIAQPMHNSNKDYGGNLFKVKFNGTDANMHATWDRLILYATLNLTTNPGFSQQRISPFAADLVKRTRKDSFPVPRSAWQLCADPVGPVYCATLWARDSNALVCDYVYGRYVEGEDLWLDSSYGKHAFYLIEQQIAKAGWRLGGWMNALAGAEGEDVEGREIPWVQAARGRSEAQNVMGGVEL